jgi:hypothetical protein
MAQSVEFSNALPFEIGKATMEEVVTAGVPYTVITVELRNGSTHTRSVDIHCEAENAEGMTWDVTGSVSQLSAGEVRSARLVKETESPLVNPTSARCVVMGFEGATPL